MKIDTYTKGILTVIAVCLLLLTVKQFDLIPVAKADQPLGPEGKYTLIPANPDGSIYIRMAPNEVMDVDLVDISTYDELEVNLVEINTSDELDVNIDEIGGSYVSSGGPIKVKSVD